ncbi:type III restriction protein res subunit [Ferroglobus placidus DSM 10642]|uniref:Type III restriction protein res subunit n=1 Tax=Ferroglobus placidus (strain DSM 10642 / AEDII12DO) TaxID=589924 RepID=D3S311_FERPA|nr:AAA domain-containing protein [Ferroglobus placidus]ADC64644.1 type III restriction protein res subunit [Ferroglobus placidus DSM 10642]
MQVKLLKDVLVRERERAVKDVLRLILPAQVLDTSESIATLESRYANLFEPGDVLGLVLGRGGEIAIRQLGTVVDSSRDILTVFTSLELAEGWDLRITNYEPLIAFDLQIDLIERIESGELEGEGAVSLFFDDLKAGEIRRAELGNKYVKGYELDESQVEAVEAALALEDGELLLIRGPPGTGKTVVIAKIAYELADQGEKVLITSHTNRAVDNAVEELPEGVALRVGRPEKVLPGIRKYLLGCKAREGLGDKLEEIEGEIGKTLKLLLKIEEDAKKALGFEKAKLNEVRRKYKEHLKELYRKRNNMLRKTSEELVEKMPVIGSTLVKSQLYPLSETDFDTVIIDESSQASITLALLGMVKGRKWVLVGDDRQLLPIFRTLRNSEKLSAFVSLLEKYPHRMKMLRVHRRSHPYIIGFSAEHFYEGKIEPAKECWKQILKIRSSIPVLNEKPVVFVHVEGEEEREGQSKFNSKEVDVCVSLVGELRRYLSPGRIGVISPYVAQRKRIAERVKGVEVGTVDAFQGREKDVVIFSVTATGNMNFVSDPNRLNVAFTRARKKLIVVGNGRAITKSDSLLCRFLEYVYKVGGIYDWERKRWLKP